MELDKLNNTSESEWDKTPILVNSIFTIVLSSFFSLFILLIIFSIDDFSSEIEDELFALKTDVPVEKVIGVLKIIFLIFLVPFILSVIGSFKLIQKSENGWTLTVISHSILLILFILGILGNPSAGSIAIFFIYLTLTILANKYRYKKENNNFNNYKN